ncbi:MAG: galactokinase [Treponema sp.]|jgi:galactokinase|nr:galactokinase [Treponema sp.]
MKQEQLLEKLRHASERVPLLFEKLYGVEEAGQGCRRYLGLAENFPFDNEVKKDDADLRLFTAAGRTELGGNHTDHNYGKVLAASVQLDQAAVAAKRADGKVFFRSTGFPDVTVDLSNLEPDEREYGTTEALIRGIAAELHKRGIVLGGISVNADSAIFAGSGLSSSAAVEVLFGRIFDNLYGGGNRTALEIAQIGQKAENVFFGKPCGLMDQTACASGGAVAIDFADVEKPLVKRVNVDLDAAGYTLCVVNTRGSHADLTPDYAAIPAEMKAVAAFFGKKVLRECDEESVESRAAEIRRTCGDRALLRALHFFDENQRVDAMLAALEKLDAASGHSSRREAIIEYLGLINDSGHSSWELLQNVYSTQNVREQGASLGLVLTRDFLRAETTAPGACRIHGGGFAGTIAAYLPLNTLQNYRKIMDAVFGADSVIPLRIRPTGAEELTV